MINIRFYVNCTVVLTVMALATVPAVCTASDLLDRDDFQWRRLNGPWSAAVHGLAIDPGDATHLIAASTGGVFHSYNGTASWVPRCDGLTVCEPMSHIRYHPVHPEIILMTGSEPFDDNIPLFRSTDGGVSWTELGINGKWNDVWIPGTHPDRYLLGGEAGLAISEDAGASWTVLTSEHYFFEFIDHPDDPDRIYAVIDSEGIAVTEDGGLSWEFRGLPETPDLDSRPNTRGIALIPGDPVTLIACRRWRTSYADGEITRSFDEGYTWETVYETGANRVRVAPSDPDVIWACGGDNHFDDWLETWIFRSDDGGTSWTKLNYSQGGMGFDLQVHPEDADTVYIGVLGFGVIVTRDGGETWEPHCRYMSGNAVYDMAVAGEEDVFVSSHSMGLWHLDTGAGRWNHLSELPTRIRVSFAVDTSDPDVIVAGSSNAYRTEDGGETWNETNMIGGSSMKGMGFDPVNSQFCYCGRTNMTDSFGIWASMDNGVSWLRKTENNAGFLAADPFNAGTLFATVWTPPSHYRLSRSTDFGTTWDDLGLPAPIWAMAADPMLPGRFYMCYDAQTPYVARTDDWGDNLTNYAMDYAVRDLAVSTLTGDVYAASEGMYASRDNGATWEEISIGLFDTEARTIGINIEDNVEQYYLGTSACGVYKWMPVDTESPAVDLLAPDGGEVLHYGETFDITWTGGDNEQILYCDLHLSPDSGASWPYVVAGAQENTGLYEWSIPLVHSNACRIKITAYDPSWNRVSDASSGDFTIIAPTFTPTPTPTNTPEPTGTPTPTPTPHMLEITLDMPAHHFTPGSQCYLHAQILNPLNTRPVVPIFIILEVMGEYWTAPSWTHDPYNYDFYKYSLSSGMTQIEVLPRFTWPDCNHAADGLKLIGFCCDPEMTGLASNIDIWEFGYGPN